MRNDYATAVCLSRSPDRWQAHVGADAGNVCHFSSSVYGNGQTVYATSPFTAGAIVCQGFVDDYVFARGSEPISWTAAVVVFGVQNALPCIIVDASAVGSINFCDQPFRYANPARDVRTLFRLVDGTASRLFGLHTDATNIRSRSPQRTASCGTIPTSTAASSISSTGITTPPT